MAWRRYVRGQPKSEALKRAQKKYYEKNKEAAFERVRQYRLRYPERCRMAVKRSFYKLTQEEIDWLLNNFKRCPVCHRKVKLHIDHCHDTGWVRGMLCNRCNVALGMLHDNPKFLARALLYLNGES